MLRYWIIAGCYDLEINDYEIFFEIEGVTKHEELQRSFVQLIEDRYGITIFGLLSMQIHLFLSMLPLHFDNLRRQQALLANSFRLYQLMKDLEK